MDILYRGYAATVWVQEELETANSIQYIYFSCLQSFNWMLITLYLQVLYWSKTLLKMKPRNNINLFLWHLILSKRD